MIDLTTNEIMILALGALGLGMYLLFKGGDWTIDGAVYVANRYGVSPLIVGFTIVAFGTSLPELIVSLNANLTGLPGIAIGNVIGSNIANILLICGVTAVFVNLSVTPRDIYRDAVKMIFATGVLTHLILTDEISRLAGVLMLAALFSYVIYQYALARKGEIPPPETQDTDFSSLKTALIFLLLGLSSIALGAEFLVRGAKVAAEIIGVPETVIGLSVIAIGTSLPELSTCIAAALKRQTDMIIGNVLGSNVFNIFMILGVISIVKPIGAGAITAQVAQFDIWVVLGVSVLFSALLLFYRKVNKPLGFLFCALYVLYIGALYKLYL